MILETNLSNVFPNIYVAFRIFLFNILVSCCENERSFSRILSMIKNKYRFMMGKSRSPTCLRILSTENDLTSDVPFEKIIENILIKLDRK